MSPRLEARIAGVFYLLTIVTGSLSLISDQLRLAANLAATACYVAVTLIFSHLFEPAGRVLSRVAACGGLLGCTIGVLGAFRMMPGHLDSLGIFGIYCLMIATLIIRSSFLPSWLGVLMAIGGLSWLTFLFPSLSSQLTPFNMAPGILAEGTLTAWLLIVGVNESRWREQARLAGIARLEGSSAVTS